MKGGIPSWLNEASQGAPFKMMDPGPDGGGGGRRPCPQPPVGVRGLCVACGSHLHAALFEG